MKNDVSNSVSREHELIKPSLIKQDISIMITIRVCQKKEILNYLFLNIRQQNVYSTLFFSILFCFLFFLGSEENQKTEVSCYRPTATNEYLVIIRKMMLIFVSDNKVS